MEKIVDAYYYAMKSPVGRGWLLFFAIVTAICVIMTIVDIIVKIRGPK